MFYTYILKSGKNNYIYVGSCKNLSKRIDQHNKGLVKSTKAYIPWKLLEYREFNTRSEAVREERFLKTGQQKELLRKKCVI